MIITKITNTIASLKCVTCYFKSFTCLISSEDIYKACKALSLTCGVGEDSWESLGLQGDLTRKSVLNIHWKHWGWSSNTLATWCEELTHWKRPWWWEGLKWGGEGGDRGWDGWMALLIWWVWVWASSGSWWWTRKTGVLQSMELQRVNTTEQLNWIESS